MLGAGDVAITYRKAELKTFVALGLEDKLADDELGLLGSVLEFSEKTVSAIMVGDARVRWLTFRHLLKTCTVYRLNGSS
jgi:Mg2+/Co2+ transporter CorC